jgi:hypothetical protein
MLARATVTGAAWKAFWVNTPAATAWVSLAMSIRSSRPECLNPAPTAENENPLGMGTMSEAMKCPFCEKYDLRNIYEIRPAGQTRRGGLTPGPDPDQKAGMKKVVTHILAAAACLAMATTALAASLGTSSFSPPTPITREWTTGPSGLCDS